MCICLIDLLDKRFFRMGETTSLETRSEHYDEDKETYIYRELATLSAVAQLQSEARRALTFYWQTS